MCASAGPWGAFLLELIINEKLESWLRFWADWCFGQWVRIFRILVLDLFGFRIFKLSF